MWGFGLLLRVLPGLDLVGSAKIKLLVDHSRVGTVHSGNLAAVRSRKYELLSSVQPRFQA